MPDKVCPPHKYRRRNLTKNKKKEPYFVFKCVDCPHLIRTDLAVGVVARCYKCNGELKITSKHASSVAKPICDDCIVKSNKTIKLEKEVDDILDSLLKDI